MNDYTQTPNYSLYKPTPNADDDVWGDHLNANADTLDGILKRLDQRGSGGAGGAGVLLVTDYLPPGQPDGITDLAPYLQDALDAAAGVTDTSHRGSAPGAFTLVFPAAAAPYIVGASLYIPSSSHIIIEPGATLQLIANAPAIAPLFQVFLMDLSGASNVIIKLYGTFDGNRLNQMGTLSTSDTSGSNNANGGIGARGCSDIFVVGNNQGTIQNFKNWPVSFTGPCINCEVRGIRMTDTGNSASFTGQNAKPDGTKSPLATTGTLSSYISPNITFVTQVAHGVNVGDYFYYTHAPAGSNQANFLQGEYIATAVPNSTTVQGVTPPGTLMPPGTFTGGVISYCWRNVNVGFVDCYVARCPDLGLVLEGGNTNGYIRGCEFTQCNGAFGVFSDPPEPAPNRDCEISGCYVHDTYGGGILVSSNQPSIFHKNIKIFDNIICNSISGGIIIDNADGVDVFGNLMHGSAYITVLDYQSQLVVKQGASNVNVYGNTIRDAIRSAYTTSGAICTLTSYTPGTGVAVLTTYASLYPPASPPLVAHGINAGDTFFLSNAAGTGACMQLEGWHTATAVTTNTVTFAAAPSLTFTLNRVNLSHFSYSVPLSHIAAAAYTSDSSGNMILTTDIPHGYPVGAPFVIASAIGSPPGTGGPPTATDSPGNLLNGMWVAQAVTTNTITISTKPNATVIVTIGTVLPGNFGIALQSPGHCHVHGNRIEDEQATPFMTSCIGGFWRNGGACHSNYFGARVAIDPDVSDYSLGGSCGINYDRVYNNAVANTSIAGFVNFSGSAQNAVQPHQYFPPQGLTLQWNYSAGRGEVDFLCGTGLGSTGGFDFLQIATIRIAATGSTYDAVTGNVSVTTSIPHTILPGNRFTLQLLTGTDAATPAGSDVRKLLGGQTANSDTTGTVLTFTDSANLTILATNGITGGLVVPSLTSSGSGLLNTAVGINGSLLANDGLGNTRLGGALVHGAMQLAPLANGGTVLVNPNTSFVLVQNSSSIATGALVLPVPVAGSFTGNGNVLEVRFQNPVGALSVTAPGGGVSGPPTSVLSAGSTFRFIQTQPGNVWLPNLPDVSGVPPVGGPYLPLSGGTVIGASVFSGGLNTTPIGAITPNTGSFTNLSATGNVTLPSTTTGPFLPLATGGTVSGATTFSAPLTTGAITSTAGVQGQTGLTAGANGATTGGAVTINAAVGNTRRISWLTANSERWRVGANNTAESGTSTGSDFFINAYNNSGAVMPGSSPFSISRSTLVTSITSAQLGTSFTYTGQAPSNTMVPLFVSASYAGSTDYSGWAFLNTVNINSDVLDVGANQQAIGLSWNQNFGGAGITGGRTGARFSLTMIGAAPANANYQASLSTIDIRSSSGGTDLWSNAAGVGFGSATYVGLTGSATNYRGAVGIEIDYYIAAGATAAAFSGLNVIRTAPHAFSPPIWENDTAITIGSATTQSLGAKIGFMVGTPNGNWPIHPTSGRIFSSGFTNNSQILLPMQAAHGIDLYNVNLTGTAFRAPGFSVLGSSGSLAAGAVQVGGGYLSASGATVSLDTAGSACTAAAIATGGANLIVGTPLIHDATGTLAWVSAVTAGAATAITLVANTGFALAGAIPANPVTFRVSTNATLNMPGPPTSPTLNLTWTAATTLALQPSGGATTFGGTVTLPPGTALPGGPFLPLATGGTVSGATTFQGGITTTGSGGVNANNSNFGRGNTYALSGSTLDVTKMGLFASNNISGTSTLGEIPAVAYVVCNSANITAGPTCLVDAMEVTMVTGGAAARAGSWQGLSVNCNDGALATNDFAGGGGGGFLAMQIARRGVKNQGGTGLTPSTSFGSNWGIDIVNVLTSGATNHYLQNGLEINQSVQSGASVVRRAGLQISSPAAHVIRGALFDSGILIANGAGAVPLRNGIMFGSALSGAAPLGTDSGLLVYQIGLDRTAPANIGIDFNDCSFTTAAMRMPGGFSVSPAGALQLSTALLTPTITGLSVDASGSVATGTPAITSGGSGYNPGEVMEDGFGGVYYNNSVAAGAVTSIIVIVQPTYPSTSPPAALSMTSRPAGVGTGCVLTPTWSTNRTALALQPSGGATTLRGVPLLPPQAQYASYTNVGNGADTTSDTLQTYTLPAGTLKNVGDRVLVKAGGVFAGTTDSKTAGLQFGGGNISVVTVNTAGQLAWRIEAEICKTGANAQTYSSLGLGSNNVSTSATATTARTDTAAIVIAVTGQNTTTATASSITCRYFTVDYIPAA